ncbi:MAG: hypothetical protein JXQ23_05050 [Clostridia bacterium]|nr:hypothetical protein [Clostridia bacterium]
MEYRYAENMNFEDFSSGRVIYQKPGMTNFPVRLASEIFERAIQHIDKKEGICLYDPMCGGGYLLTVLGILHHEKISEIIGSDIDEGFISFALKNFSLLSEQGIEKRIIELTVLAKQFGKTSHIEAVESAKRIKKIIAENKKSIKSQAIRLDILNVNKNEEFDFKADILFTDIPYNQIVSWVTDNESFMKIFESNLEKAMKSGAVLAICSDKKQKLDLKQFIRLEKTSVGKRKFEIYRLGKR